MKIKAFFQGIKNGQKEFGESISALINAILLSFVYLIGVGMTALVAKILRKHFLDLKPKKSRDSYWEDLNLGKEGIERYYHQF